MRMNNYLHSKTCLVYSILLFVIGISLFYSNIDSKKYNVQPVKFAGLMCMLLSAVLVIFGLCLWLCESAPRPNVPRQPQIHMISVREPVLAPSPPRVDYSQDLPPSYEEVMKYHVDVPINVTANGASISPYPVVIARQEDFRQDNLNLNHFILPHRRSSHVK